MRDSTRGSSRRGQHMVRLQMDDLIIYTSEPEGTLTKVRGLPSRDELVIAIGDDPVDTFKKAAEGVKAVTGAVRDGVEMYSTLRGKKEDPPKDDPPKTDQPDAGLGGGASGGAPGGSGGTKAGTAGATPRVAEKQTYTITIHLTVKDVEGPVTINLGGVNNQGGASQPSPPASQPPASPPSPPASQPPASPPSPPKSDVLKTPDDAAKGGGHIDQPTGFVPSPADQAADAVMRQFLAMDFDTAEAAMSYLQGACAEVGVEVSVTELGVRAKSTVADRAGVRGMLLDKGIKDEDFIEQVVGESEALISMAENYGRSLQATAASAAMQGSEQASQGGVQDLRDLITKFVDAVPPELALTSRAPAGGGGERSTLEPKSLLALRGFSPSGVEVSLSLETQVTTQLMSQVEPGFYLAPAVSFFEKTQSEQFIA